MPVSAWEFFVGLQQQHRFSRRGKEIPYQSDGLAALAFSCISICMIPFCMHEVYMHACMRGRRCLITFKVPSETGLAPDWKLSTYIHTYNIPREIRASRRVRNVPCVCLISRHHGSFGTRHEASATFACSSASMANQDTYIPQPRYVPTVRIPVNQGKRKFKMIKHPSVLFARTAASEPHRPAALDNPPTPTPNPDPEPRPQSKPPIFKASEWAS